MIFQVENVRRGKQKNVVIKTHLQVRHLIPIIIFLLQMPQLATLSVLVQLCLLLLLVGFNKSLKFKPNKQAKII